MKVDYAFIAEAADAVNGLFYVVRGGTDIWHTPEDIPFPLGIGPMSFVIKLSGDPSEVGKDLALRTTIVDADGHSVGFEGQGQIQLPPHPVDRTKSGTALIHFRMAFQIPAPGVYLFELHSDQTRLCQVPLWVIQGSGSQG